MARPSKPWWHKALGTYVVKRNKQIVRLSEDRAEAMRMFHRLMAEDGKGQGTPGAAMRLGELVERWLAALPAALSPATVRSYREYAGNLAGHLGLVPIRDLKPSHVQMWLDANPGWKSAGTRNLAVSIAKLVGGFAVDEGYIDRDPFQRVRRPAMPRRKASTRAAATSLIHPGASAAVADFLAVALETGCRPGELRTLEAARIDWKARTAVVLGKKTRANPEGRRTVHLSAKAAEILSRWARDFPEGAVLRNTRGKPWTAKAIQCQFNRLSKKAGVKVVPYQTRGIFATEAIRAGIDSLHISKLLGHSDVSVLGKHYADVKEQDLAEVMRKREKPAPRPKRRRRPPRRGRPS